MCPLSGALVLFVVHIFRMNHPYLYPDECPWEPEYDELRRLRNAQRRQAQLDQEDYDYQHGYTPRRPGR